MIPPDWLWIPVTIGAALAQTVRNATQRHLTPVLGTLGATLVRFLYGLPFAVLWLIAVASVGDFPLPPSNTTFWIWVVVGSTTQIGATALLLRVMAARNLAVGVAYTKTEVLQIALFGFIFLGDPVMAGVLGAIAFSTLGVLLLSPIDRNRPIRSFLSGWTTRAALLGLAAGSCFAMASVGFRGAALALEGAAFPMAAAYTLVMGQALQTVLLGGWLLVRNASVVVRVLREWRKSILAGLMGAIASACWFTAFAIEPAAHVKTLALIEIFFSYIIGRRIFSDTITRLEGIGMMLLCAGLVLVTLHA